MKLWMYAIPLILCLCPAVPVVGQTTFEFGLEGGQEVPPVVTAATGVAVGVLDAGQTQFDLTITHDIDSPTMAHIHLGAPGVNGAVIFDLGDPTSPIVVSWNPDAGEVDSLLAGDLYVNLHSSEHTGGEIRGQIVPDCRPGTVNLASGSVTDVLFVNGSAGGAGRTVSVDSADDFFLWAVMLPPPAGGNGKFVVHADLGAPSGATMRVLPADVGTTCFPFLTSAGASPDIVANNLGKENLIGSSNFFGAPTSDPGRAPAVFLQIGLPEAQLPPGTTITFQGITVDPGGVSNKGASSTNAVVVRIL